MRKAYLSDLTDSQWQRLYATLFAPVGYPESIREVVNGILYWERACGIWWLLPPGFPPVEELQKHYEQWEQDGTWARVTELVPEPGLTPRFKKERRRRVAGWRKHAARNLRQLPGGPPLLAVARVPIHVGQFVHRLVSPHFRWLRALYRAIRQADQSLWSGRHAAAVRSYTRALKLAPWHPHPLIGRAMALFELKVYDRVIQDASLALSAPIASADHRQRAHNLLAWSIALTGGDLDRAVRHVTEAWWAYRREKPGFRPETGPVTQLETLMIAYDDLAEYLINYHMAFPLALELYRRKPAVRSSSVDRLAEFIPSNGLILSEDWVRNIGHIAYLDTFAKMKAMKWADWDRMILLAPPLATSNLHYAKYWSGLYDVISDGRLIDSLKVVARSTGPRVAGLLRLPDGNEKYFTEAIGAVQEAWEREGRDPLISLTAEDQAFGQDILARLGVPPGSWFVCLHVREPGYHKEWNNKHQEHRNADIRTYYRAVREIVRRGGWVIRLGDKSMRRLPKMAGVVDYAHSKFKSERMDVFLCGACRFFLGVASGMCHIPTTFGVPCVLTNWVSNALPVYSQHDLFLPKLLHSAGLGRQLNFHEMFGPVPRQAAYSGVFLEDHGLTAIDNTSVEINEAVVEMLDRLEGVAQDDRADRELQEQLAGILRSRGLIGFARVGRDFLRRHATLLPGRAPAIAPLPRPAAA